MPNINARHKDRMRVATAVQKRRTELGFTQEQLSTIAGVSLRTVQNAETGESVLSPLSRSRLERALELPLGHLEQIYRLDGKASHVDVSELLSSDIVEILDHPDLTPDMRRTIVELLNKEHERFARRAIEFFGLRDVER